MDTTTLADMLADALADAREGICRCGDAAASPCQHLYDMAHKLEEEIRGLLGSTKEGN